MLLKGALSHLSERPSRLR
nr:TPA_asm: m106.5 uORF 2 RNA *1 [Murid betaherpesvirus 1]DBA08063.1 TPA_asm: m106.5 uORF 2 RNA *1 [Murid betaherpesvirus 1]